MKSNTSTANSSSPFGISDFSSSSKYGGLLEERKSKKLFRMYQNMLNYMDSMLPGLYSLHRIISFIRTLQMFGLMFLSNYASLYPRDNVVYKFLNWLSVFWNIIPIQYRDECSFVIAIIYAILIFAFFAVITISARYYEQNGSLSIAVIYIIHLFISIIGYIIHVPCLEICFETVSKMIVRQTTYHDFTYNIVTIVLTLVTFVFYYFFYRKLYSYSFIFRPTSFMCINGVQQMGSLQVQSFEAIGVGLATYLPKVPQGIITILLAFAALSCYFTIYRSFSLVSFLHNTIFLTFAIFGFCAYIVFAIFVFMGVKMTVGGLFIYLGLLVISFIICHFITQMVIRKTLVFLDNIYENKELLLDEPDSMKLFVCSTIGFHFAHPSSLDFTIFKYITDKEPDNTLFLVIYGKFVAIYPEYSDTLNYIIRTIIQRKMHGIMVKQALSQSRIIFQQRESNLTSDLKKKLNKVQKDISIAKRRLRHVWDQVIQGNISELDSSIANAYSMKSKCDAQFNLLLVQLPNNRFLYRTYSNYLIEVSNDADKYIDTMDKVRMLSRGIKVHEDHTQELGLHAFPQLPSMIIMNMPLGSSSANEVSESVVFTEEFDDETIARKQEDNRSLMDLIESLHIPSLVTTNVLVGSITVFSFMVSVVLLGLIISYKNRIKKPLKYSDSTAWARYYAASATSFAHLYILNKTRIINFTGYQMSSYANESLLQNQLKYAISQLIASLKSLSAIRNFKTQNPIMISARNMLYNNSLNYTSFSTDRTTNKTEPTSLIAAFNDIIMRLTEITELEDDEINITTLTSPSMRNPFYNIENVIKTICETTDLMTYYMERVVNFMHRVMSIDQGALSLFLAAVLIIIMIVVYKKIKRDKETIYRTLLVLPKNVVSQISESLRSVNKDDSMKSGNLTSTTHMGNDLERNRQEENLMKVLTAASDESTRSTELNLMLIALGVFAFSAVCINIIIASLYIDVGVRLKENCQHVDHILGVATFLDLMAMQANDLAAIKTKGAITDTMDIRKKYQQINIYKDNLTDYYSAMRYGHGTGHPFPDFRQFVSEAKRLAKCNQTQFPADLRDGLSCFSPDILIKYSYIFFRSIIDPMLNPYIAAQPNITNLILADELAMFRIYDDFLSRASHDIVIRIDDLMNAKIPVFISTCIVLTCVIVICYLFVVSITRIISDKLKYALSLLLACQTSMVMQNSYIMSILSGNFSHGSGDSSTRDNAFYDNLVEELPDAIVVTTGANYKVISSNKAANALFKEELANNSFSGYIQSSHFSPETNSQLNRLFDPTMKSSSCNVQYVKGDPDKKFLFISRTSALVGDNVIFTIRNTTQTFVYNKLISEERAKSDQLLATILPASLVPRVQAGEKNISFSVGSATISFIDIVEFTPWCSSNTAQVITGVLNEIFTEFDAIVKSLPVMERIKCIGDCYMCAGGIFAETPNLLQFARATVDFGLEAINAIKRVNENHGMSLRVRVGQHIGGPVVAGVIGIGKPTFEIFGPAISYAQQMEHNGVPMKVHVSRALYELIYGGNYKIEERGEIQIKQGKVLTYLVDGYVN